MEEIELLRGFQFNPTHQDSLLYLEDKVAGRPIPDIILERDPYDVKQIDDIFLAADKRDIFFFTKLRPKSKVASSRSTNISRTVGKGSWRGEQTHDIKNKDGSFMGTARKLSYSDPSSRNNKRCTMTEYALPTQDHSVYNLLKDWVLCRVNKSSRWRGGRITNNSSGCDHINIQEAPSLLVAADLNQVPVATSGYSSMSAGDSEIYEVEGMPINNHSPYTTVETQPIQTYDELHNVLLGDSDNTTTAAASTAPYTIVGNYDACEVEAPALQALPSAPDGNDELCDATNDFPWANSSDACEVDDTLINSSSLLMGVETPALVIDGNDEIYNILMGFDYGIDIPPADSSSYMVSDNSYTSEIQAASINDSSLSPEDEFATVETLVPLEDGNEGVLDTLQGVDYGISNQLANWISPEPSNGEDQVWTDELWQFDF